MSLYPPPEVVPLKVWSELPAEFRRRGQTPDWAAANRPGGDTVDCFLEGPSFDRDGNLYVTDIPYGRVFRIAPDRTWTLVAEYDGWPNGLKIHKDGRIFITDYKYGIMQLDPVTGHVTPYLTHRKSEGFRGVNDLFFDRGGRIYFTDQGQTGMHDPTGRVYRYDPDGDRLDLLVTNAPSPNGLVMNPEENVLYVAVTRGNGVWRVPGFPAASAAPTAWRSTATAACSSATPATAASGCSPNGASPSTASSLRPTAGRRPTSPSAARATGTSSSPNPVPAPS